MGRFLLLAAFQLSLIPLISDPPSLSPSATSAPHEVYNTTDYDSVLLRPRLAPLSSPPPSRNSELVYFLPHLTGQSPQSLMSLNTSSQYPVLSKSRRAISASLKAYRNVNYRRLVKFHSRWVIQRLSRGIRKLRLRLPCRIERAKALLTGRLSPRCHPAPGLPSKPSIPPVLTAAFPPPASPPPPPLATPHPAIPSTRTEYVHIPPAPVLYVPPTAQVEAHIHAFRVLFTALVFIIPATLAMNRVSTKHVPGNDAPQPTEFVRMSCRLRKSLFLRRKNLLSFVRGFAHSSKPRKRKTPRVQRRPRATRSPRAFMYARPRAVPLAASPLLPLDGIQLAQPWSSLSVVSAYKPPAAVAQSPEDIHIRHPIKSSHRQRMRVRPYAARSPRAFKYARPARVVRSLSLANLSFSKTTPSHLTTSSFKDPTPDAPQPTHYNEYLALTVPSSLLDIPPKEHTFDIQVNYMRNSFASRGNVQVGQCIYRWQETLGKGSFGVVSLYKAGTMHGETSLPDEIAVKQVAMEVDPEEGEEVAAMHRLEGNKWAVECLGRVHYRSETYILMRYYPSRSLHEYLLNQPEGKLPRDMALHYIAELITAVHELHKNGIMHRDVKPSNVFLSSNGHEVLGDFGIARAFPPPATSSTPPLYPQRESAYTVASASGTVPFSAPEVMQRKMYSFGVDYYAVAVLGHVLLTGNLPFAGSVQAIKDDPGNVALRSLILGSGLSVHEKDWFRAMLHHDPAKRIQSVEAIKHHAMFNQTNWEAVAAQSAPVPHFHEDAFSAFSESESGSDSDDDDESLFHDSSPSFRGADLSSSDGEGESESEEDEPFYDSSPLYHPVDL